MLPFIVLVITMIILFLPLAMSQELIHWFVIVGVRIRVSKYDVDYGIRLDLP